jgi:hypothetical protein
MGVNLATVSGLPTVSGELGERERERETSGSTSRSPAQF